jgi:acetyl-CoA carboxylase biotin carboxyl carrier protein
MASLKELQKFIKEISETGLYKIEIKTDDFELKIQSEPEVKINKDAVVVQQTPAVNMSTQPVQQAPVKQETTKAETKKEEENLIPIKAPMVGTFYRKPAPDKDPFVEVGDHIKKGDVVCIIEAMKIFNEKESEVSGEIVKILVDDATPVEFDQTLFLVKPS